MLYKKTDSLTNWYMETMVKQTQLLLLNFLKVGETMKYKYWNTSFMIKMFNNHHHHYYSPLRVCWIQRQFYLLVSLLELRSPLQQVHLISMVTNSWSESGLQWIFLSKKYLISLIVSPTLMSGSCLYFQAPQNQ